MPGTRRRTRPLIPALVLAVLGAWSLPGRADTVVLNNGIVYRGTVDKDKPLLWVYDGLKRVVLRDSKVARIDSDASFRNLEVFRIEQPLVVHGGSMPKDVVNVVAGPWNDRGRRSFAYEARIGKVTRMEQAINEMGPHLVKIRGVDGYWQGQLSTARVPREIILAILAKVEKTDRNERVRVARFLIQAEWYDEARAALDGILKDFPGDPDLRDRVAAARASVLQLSASKTKAAIDLARQANQPRAAASLLKSFPVKDVSAELVGQIEEARRHEEARADADKALADGLSALAGQLKKEERDAWEGHLLEVFKALKDAPDAVRDRFVAWQKANSEGGKANEALFALAMSGFVVGTDAAVEDLETAKSLWDARDQVRGYLASTSEETRSDLIAKLEALKFPDVEPALRAYTRLDTLTRLSQRMSPPTREEGDEKPGVVKIRRVRDDENAEPTEYAVTLPPEYHPLRSYPAVVALHDGTGTEQAISWWSTEAAKRGYVVVAPDYLKTGKKEFEYTAVEHAAVELALRDARRRYAIDSDRVFVGGQLVGANAAWDVGLAHPDEFAGVVVISGFPVRYIPKTLEHTRFVPLYVALGDLAPASNEVVFGKFLKPLIAKAYDVTYLEYLRRGLEDFPEEAPAVFDWMDRRRRESSPKRFEAVTARASDVRFFGAVIQDFLPGRTTEPVAVEPFGQNLKPATVAMQSSGASNLLNFTTTGVKRFDVWVSPKLIDFKRRMEVRHNRRSLYKGPARPTPEDFLEDLRIRGDRQQVYWMKVSAG